MQELTEVESSRTFLTSRTSLSSRTSSRTHFEVLGLETSSPWPRTLRSSKIALSSARGQHYFWTVEILLKTPETSRKICKYLLCFTQLEHRLSQAGLPLLIEISPMTKLCQKSLLFIHFQFLFSIFRLHQQRTRVVSRAGFFGSGSGQVRALRWQKLRA